MSTWRVALPELLSTASFRTQADIVQALQEATGRRLNQATVSRELHKIGARKVDGVYRLAPPPDLGAPVHALHVTAEHCLAVVKTDPAFASVLAQAIDDSDLPGLLGTISGDDTVFVALTGAEAMGELRRLLGVGYAARRRS